jgi:type IV pilus assembly protein PilM
MAAVRNCLGLDIGTHSMRVAYMEMGKAGPRVVKLFEEPLSAVEGLSEADRNQAIAKQLQDRLKAERIRCKHAVYCIPGQSVFVRRIKLPKASAERMHRMVRHEARQQIPFPLDKTIMEYQVFEEPNVPEANVLMVAIKRDYIMNFMRMVRRIGLSPVAISVSTLALYNFHEVNTTPLSLVEVKKTTAQPKKEKKAKARKGSKGEQDAIEELHAEDEEHEPLEAMGFEEIQAYVNIGSSLMDIAVPKPGATRMIGFPRSVPLAGNEMDRLIRDRLGLESLDDARRIKEHESVVLSSEFEMQEEMSINRPASEAVTQVVDRLINELRRSMDFYISQPDGVAVDSIVLTGGLARLRFLPGYVEEKLGIPVMLAEPRHADLRMPEPAPDPFFPYAIAVGLGLQGLGLAQNSIDFLPEDIKSIRSLQSRRKELAAVAAMLLVVLGMSVNVGANHISEYRNATATIEQEIEQAEVDSRAIKTAQAQHRGVAEAYTKLGQAAGWRDYWLLFMQLFIERRPGDVLIDEFHMRADGNVIIRGVTPNRASVNQMVGDLQNDPAVKGWMVQKIELSSERTVSDRRFPGPVSQFEIVIKTLVKGTRIESLGEQPLTLQEIQQRRQGRTNNSNTRGIRRRGGIPQ